VRFIAKYFAAGILVFSSTPPLFAFDFVPGDFYTTFRNAPLIEHFDSSGNFVDSLQLPYGVEGLAFGPDGLLYVVTAGGISYGFCGTFNVNALDSSGVVHASYSGTNCMSANTTLGSLSFGQNGKFYVSGGDLTEFTVGQPWGIPVSIDDGIFTGVVSTKPLPSGNILVMNWDSPLQEISSSGHVLRTIVPPIDLYAGHGVDYEPAINSIFYSMQGYSGESDQIIRMDGNSGQLIAQGSYYYVDQILISHDRRLIAASSERAAQSFDLNLTPLTQFGFQDAVPQEFVAEYPFRPQSRIADTRSGFASADGHFGALRPATSISVQLPDASVTGGVSGVALNLVVTNPSSPGYLTMWPSGTSQPATSNINFVGGQTVANLAIIGGGQNNQVQVYNSAGKTDVIADAQWFFTPAQQLRLIEPVRLLDTRKGYSTDDRQYAGIGALSAGGILKVQIAGRGGIPRTELDANSVPEPGQAGAATVVVNVTATNSTEYGYVTAWASNQSMPGTSNLNLAPGNTVANLVVSQVDTKGQISLFNATGQTDLIVDAVAWFPASSNLKMITPSRLLDTRASANTIDGQFRGGGALAGGSVLGLTVTGRAGIPHSNVDGVILNLTTTNPTGPGYAQVWTSGGVRPYASNLNYESGQTVANLAFVVPGADGKVSLSSSTNSADLIVDVVGWFQH